MNKLSKCKQINLQEINPIQQSNPNYITLHQAKLYQNHIEQQMKKYQSHLYHQQNYLFGHFIWQLGKQFFQNHQKNQFKQINGRFKKIKPKLYLLDLPINTHQSSHRLTIELLLGLGNQFQVSMVDSHGLPMNKIKFGITYGSRTLSLKIWIPIQNQFKIWKQLQLPLNPFDKITITYQQGYDSNAFISINQYQFKLFMVPFKHHFAKYLLYVPFGVDLGKVSLLMSPSHHLPKNIQNCKCQNNCLIF